MNKSVVRVLVVDDFERWRVAVTAMLAGIPGLQVIGEASEGEEAVQMALDLQPDLIVLDIGLPYLNGIEVARKVGRICPFCKIVFLTENRSCDLAEEALRAGASGYVIKNQAHSELIPAIKAVLANEQFLSPSLTALTMTP
jgi:DNA-binding NarL/FixJ family response regulator